MQNIKNPSPQNTQFSLIIERKRLSLAGSPITTLETSLKEAHTITRVLFSLLSAQAKGGETGVSNLLLDEIYLACFLLLYSGGNIVHAWADEKPCVFVWA